MSEGKAHNSGTPHKSGENRETEKWCWKQVELALELFISALRQAHPETNFLARPGKDGDKKYVDDEPDGIVQNRLSNVQKRLCALLSFLSGIPVGENITENNDSIFKIIFETDKVNVAEEIQRNDTGKIEIPATEHPELNIRDVHITFNFSSNPVLNESTPQKHGTESQKRTLPSASKPSYHALPLSRCTFLFDPIARSFDFIYVAGNCHFHNYGSAVSARQPKRYDFLCSAMSTAKEKLVRADKDTVKNIRSALRKCCRKHGHRLGADPIQNVGGEFYRILIPILQKPDEYKPQPHLSLDSIEELDSDRRFR